MTIRELQYAIQDAIDTAPFITDDAEVVVSNGSIYAVQRDEDGSNWHSLGKIEKEG